MEEENIEIDAPTSIVKDREGRQLICYLEHSLEIDGQEYVLLLPVDFPVEIFAWPEDDDRNEPVPIESDAEIDELFDLAKAVLAEQNLTLKRTAVTLTVAGKLSHWHEKEQSVEEIDPDREEFQLLASFYYEQQEYDVYMPLDPLFILAQIDEAGNPQLLSTEEFEKIEPLLPQIEDQLYKTLQ